MNNKSHAIERDLYLVLGHEKAATIIVPILKAVQTRNKFAAYNAKGKFEVTEV